VTKESGPRSDGASMPQLDMPRRDLDWPSAMLARLPSRRTQGPGVLKDVRNRSAGDILLWMRVRPPRT